MRISAPPQSSLTVKVGRLERKAGSYDIWALGADGDAEGDEGAGVGGEELHALSALLPRPKKGGKLYLGASSSNASLSRLTTPARISI